MAERVLILAGVALAIAAGWWLVRLWSRLAVRRMQAASPFSELVPAGRPAVIAFSTPQCAECRTLQAPALRRLEQDLGERVTVRSLMAHEHPELVDKAGILTVPATVVLDARGAVRHLNLGYADAGRLAEQVLGACKTAAAVL